MPSCRTAQAVKSVRQRRGNDGVTLPFLRQDVFGKAKGLGGKIEARLCLAHPLCRRGDLSGLQREQGEHSVCLAVVRRTHDQRVHLDFHTDLFLFFQLPVQHIIRQAARFLKHFPGEFRRFVVLYKPCHPSLLCLQYAQKKRIRYTEIFANVLSRAR